MTMLDMFFSNIIVVVSIINLLIAGIIVLFGISPSSCHLRLF